jgi:GT2 family glycosyltransferase
LTTRHPGFVERPSAGARVSICIVTWNHAADVVGCLRSLDLQTRQPDEIVVVDNGSTDGTPDAVRRAAPRAAVVELPDNAGFCRAMNVAISRSRGDYVVTLNPDCRLERTFLDRAASALDGSPDVGSVAAKLVRFDGDEPSGRESTIDSAGLADSWTRRIVNRGEGRFDDGRWNSASRVFGACAAAAAYRRRALAAVSGPGEVPFDEAFVAYKEDADLAWRLRRAGWSCLYEPRAVALHRRRWRRENRRDVPLEIRRRSLVNRWLLLAKNESLARFVLELPILAAIEAAILVRVLASEPSLRAAYADGRRRVIAALKRRIAARRAAGAGDPATVSSAEAAVGGR